MYKILLLYINIFITSIICKITQRNSKIEKQFDSSIETVTVPTSCLGLEDGYHFIKLLQDDTEDAIQYPILHVLCNNEYIIIDYSLDPEWDSYFTTWIKYHYGVVGPIRNDKSNWSEWFLPDTFTQSSIDTTGNYLVSPECNTCSINIAQQLHDTQSSYYMSALAFGCFNEVRGWPACDFDYDTYECKICQWDSKLTQISSEYREDTLTWEDALDNNLKTGICDFEIRSSIQSVSQSFTKCAAQGMDNRNWKPSLGIDGRYCQCYKPYYNKRTHITVRKTRLEKKRKHVLNAQKDMDILSDSLLDITRLQEYKLYETDFESGTYRIMRPGIYIIMEDIEFDFNAPPKGDISANNVYDNFYWPLEDDEDIYPGAGSSRDPFFLGFFAGITVECDNVILDLNGKELRMSRPFYYQQPFFSIIELASQPFLPQQGPGFFGAEPHFATNIEIKNGVIGLTSHHGIHGNNNHGIIIHDVIVKNFNTHGIQLNGFNGLTIKNVEIGPSTQRAYLNGNYGQIRLLLPKMAKIAREHKEDYISFNGRKHEKVTMQDLIDKVVEMMDMVLSYVIDGRTYEDNDYWDEAVEAFINPSGLPMGAVLYGLFLNYPSAGIFGWHVNNQNSYDANLENVYIHDLRHKGIEVVGFNEGGRVVCNGFNGPIPARDIFGDEQIKSFQSKLYSDDDDNIEYAQYVGSIISDIHIAMYYFGRDDFDNWSGIPFYGFGDKIIEWAMGKMPHFISSEERNKFGFYCNEDAMFHPAKGLLALKISGVKDVTIKNIQIKNLQDETPLGSTLCGEITKPQHGLYHFAQQIPYQIGFSMNMVMGITIDFSTVKMIDTHINDLYSNTGLVYGFAAWFESVIDVNGELKINNLYAGVEIDDDNYNYNDLPNKASEACSVRLFDDDSYQLTYFKDDGLDLYQTCINGAVGCLGHNNVYTHFDHVLKTDDINKCHTKTPFEYAPNDFNELMESETSFIPKHDDNVKEINGHIMSFMDIDYVFINNNFGIYLIFIAIFIICLFIIKMMFVSANRNNKTEQLNPTELTQLIQSDVA